MPPLTKRRWSTRRQGQRRKGHKNPLPTLSLCKHCGELKRPHFRCGKCGKP